MSVCARKNSEKKMMATVVVEVRWSGLKKSHQEREEWAFFFFYFSVANVGGNNENKAQFA